MTILSPEGLEEARSPEKVQANNRGYIHTLFVADEKGPVGGRFLGGPSIIDFYKPVELFLIGGWWG